MTLHPRPTAIRLATVMALALPACIAWAAPGPKPAIPASAPLAPSSSTPSAMPSASPSATGAGTQASVRADIALHPSAQAGEEALNRLKAQLSAMSRQVAQRVEVTQEKDLREAKGPLQRRRGERVISGWDGGTPQRSWVQPVHPELTEGGEPGLPAPWGAADHPGQLLDMVDSVGAGQLVQRDGVEGIEWPLRGHMPAEVRGMPRQHALVGSLFVRSIDGQPVALRWSASGLPMVSRYEYRLDFSPAQGAVPLLPAAAELLIVTDMPFVGRVGLTVRERYVEWASKPAGLPAADSSVAATARPERLLASGPAMTRGPLPPQPITLPTGWLAADAVAWQAQGQRAHSLFSAPERFQWGPLTVTEVKRSWTDVRETQTGNVNQRVKRSTLSYQASGPAGEAGTWSGQCQRTERATSLFNTRSYDENTDTELSCTCTQGSQSVSLKVDDKLAPGHGEMNLGGEPLNVSLQAVPGYTVNLRVPTPGYLFETRDGLPIGAVDTYGQGRAWWRSDWARGQHAPAACLTAGLLLSHGS